MATRAVQALSDLLDELHQTLANYEDRQEQLRLTIMNVNDDISNVHDAIRLLTREDIHHLMERVASTRFLRRVDP